MVTVNALLNYCRSLYKSGAMYLWGADGQVGSEYLLDSLIKRFGANNYKNVSLPDIEGKFCMDCSGMLTPITGTDMTASAYYQKCSEKGKAADIPSDKVCLIFRQESGRIVHVAVYMGDGRLCEMWDRCDIRDFKASQWTYYGFPDWLEKQDGTFDPFIITVLKDNVPYISEPSFNAKINGYLQKGYKYTIVEENDGYGRLKSGAGWVMLDKSNVAF